MTVPAVLRHRDHVVPQVVGAAALVRLLALVVGLATMLDRRLAPEVVLAVVLLAASSYVGVARRRSLALAVRHPILSLLDVVLVLVVLAVVGVDSPIVIATLSTALVVGLLQRPAAAALVTVALVSGYLAVWRLSPGVEGNGSFTVAVGTPLLYVSFVLVGFAVRSAQERQAAAEADLAATLETVAHERERSRLAREMHDSLAKTLHGLVLGAAALPHWVGRDTARARQAADDLAAGLEQASDEARALLSRMRADEPGADLGAVIRRHSAEWAERHGAGVTVDVQDVDIECPDVRYELLAVLGEALENVHRHAKATHVRVCLAARDEGVHLTITDDGRGFDPDGTATRRWGVVGMTERMQQLGGALAITTCRGGGTRVHARAPLHAGSRGSMA